MIAEYFYTLIFIYTKMKLTLIYTTCKDEGEAKSMGKRLLKLKLVACINIFPINSCYIWEGECKDCSEAALLCKLLPKNESKVREKIKEFHSYKVPAILSWKARVNKEYYDYFQ